MSAIHTDGTPRRSRATARSSQSTFVAPGTRISATTRPVRLSSAKNRAVSPLSFWA
jgi:hypothetical protein